MDESTFQGLSTARTNKLQGQLNRGNGDLNGDRWAIVKDRSGLGRFVTPLGYHGRVVYCGICGRGAFHEDGCLIHELGEVRVKYDKPD